MSAATVRYQQRTKIGRNQPCPCGSGTKFKRCCGSLVRSGPEPAFAPSTEQLQKLRDRQAAAEKIRKSQQGHGRPIITCRFNDYRIVAVGTRVCWGRWMTPADFLGWYIKDMLGNTWGITEIAKPLPDRHPILQWYDAYCRFQQGVITKPGEVSTAQITGAVACYLGLAYGLYELEHNVDLQRRLIKRLKDIAQFQGAYYEVIVARVLIRAGFTLELEDEKGGDSKHCEFSAVSPAGKKYWVEAKMRGVAGVLGKTEKNGTSDKDPIKGVPRLLRKALDKPAPDSRLIFIDLNTEESVGETQAAWHAPLGVAMDNFQTTKLKAGESAYVFITNMAYHRRLVEPASFAVAPYGLGIPTFASPEPTSLAEAYLRKIAHRDAHAILEAFKRDADVPPTFDGLPPSEAYGGSPRYIVGETYTFPEHNIVGTVESVCLVETSSEIWIVVRDQNGHRLILKNDLSPDALADAKEHEDAYFGVPRNSRLRSGDPLELFEDLMGVYGKTSRELLLEWLKDHPNRQAFEALADGDLRLAYVEMTTLGMLRHMRHQAA